jgi:hypothetical protein
MPYNPIRVNIENKTHDCISVSRDKQGVNGGFTARSARESHDPPHQSQSPIPGRRSRGISMLRNPVIRIAGAVAGSLIVLAAASQAEAAPRHYRGGNNGAAAALAIGALALGVGAAIAASERREREYAPAYGYGAYPAYGYGYQQPQYVEPQVHYAPQAYYAPQGYYSPKAAWGNGYGGYGVRHHRHAGTYWQQRARDRQQRDQN